MKDNAGFEQYRADKKGPRWLAAQLLYDIEKGGYANLALDKAMRSVELCSRDKSLVTELVNGTVRMEKHLDWVLNLFLKKDIGKQHPWVRNTLRMSLYQILFMERIPVYACVNEAVDIGLKAGKNLGRVVNGVLRNIIRNQEAIEYPLDPVEYLAVYYSHPEWMVEEFLSMFGKDKSREILEYNNRAPAVVLRNNSLKCSEGELLRLLEEEGFSCEKSPLLPGAIRVKTLDIPIFESAAFQQGYFYVQNEASILAALILSPKPGSTVYDLCCGVGGKTTHLAELMNNQGCIQAFDIYRSKIKLLQQNCERLGVNIVNGQAQNALNINSRQVSPYVLLDVPCSGWGVLSRRADSRWRKNREDISKLAELQYKLMVKAGEIVSKGGVMLYCTCTINRAENEKIVQKFLQNYHNFTLEGFDRKLTFFPLKEEDRKKAAGGMLTLIPGQYDCDGMFYARLRRAE